MAYSPYKLVQNSKLYTILMILSDFKESLNIVTDSQYAKGVVLPIETAELIQDDFLTVYSTAISDHI